jgi:cytochrome c553
MSSHLAKWAKSDRGRGGKPDKEEKKNSPDEQRALKTLQREAKQAGSDLATGGEGGLPPSTVLGVMRKANYECKACGRLGDMETNGGLSIHHKSEHLENPKAKARSQLLRSQGKKDAESNIVALCAHCHDAVHERDRAEYGDAEQKAHPERH